MGVIAHIGQRGEGVGPYLLPTLKLTTRHVQTLT